VSTEEQTREQIRHLIRELAPIPTDTITDETQLVVDLGYDSLQQVELAVALEDHFQLPSADEEDAANIETVGEVEERIFAMLAARHAAEVIP
jgi:acyl carrier protein